MMIESVERERKTLREDFFKKVESLGINDDEEYYKVVMDITPGIYGGITYEDSISVEDIKYTKVCRHGFLWSETVTEKQYLYKTFGIYAIKNRSGIYEAVSHLPITVWDTIYKTPVKHLWCYGLVEPKESKEKILINIDLLKKNERLRKKYVTSLELLQNDVYDKRASEEFERNKIRLNAKDHNGINR